MHKAPSPLIAASSQKREDMSIQSLYTYPGVLRYGVTASKNARLYSNAHYVSNHRFDSTTAKNLDTLLCFEL
jgi:hypothetical protein